MKIEDLERKIYNLEKEEKKEEKSDVLLKQNNLNLIDDKNIVNQVIETKEVKSSNKKKNKFLIILIIISFLIILSSGIYFFVFLKQAPLDNFEIKFEFPKHIYTGVPFNFDLILNNISNVEVKDVKLIVLLPDDVLVYDNFSQLKQNLGNIKSKEIIKKTFSILVLNEEIKTLKKIKVILDYSLGSHQRFQFIKEDNFFVFEEPIKVEVQKPDYVFFEQEFDVFIKFHNLTNFYYQKLFLEFIFPKNFELISYENFKQISLNNFVLDEIKPLENKIIKLKGKIKRIDSQDLGENINLNFGLILKDDLLENQKDNNLILTRNNFSLDVLKDIISLDLLINKNKNYIVKNNDKLNFEIQFKNSLPKKLFDLVLKIKFLDDFFNFETLKTDGYFDSQQKILVWNSNNSFNLKELEAKKIKSVNFSLNLNDLTNLNLKNPKISLEVILESPTIVDPKTDKTFLKKVFDLRIKNNVSLVEEIYYQDPEGYMNLGNLPLKFNEKTQFTVYWFIKNMFNDLKNVKVKTSLASGVDLIKIIFVNNKNKPIYNNKTKELIWFFDKIDAGVGYNQEAIKLVFQLEVLPAKWMVNKFMTLINEINLEAEDVMTKEKISIKLPPLTSEKISGFDLEMLKVVE